MTWARAYTLATNEIYRYLESKGIKGRCQIIIVGPKTNAKYVPSCFIAEKTMDIPNREEVFRFINSTFKKHFSSVTTTSISRWSRTLRRSVTLPFDKNTVIINLDVNTTTIPRIPLKFFDYEQRPY